MTGLLPLWVLLAWIFFPALAVAAGSTSSSFSGGNIERLSVLRPWPEETTSNIGACADSRCSLHRPAWRGNQVLPGRILLVSVGFYGHAIPMLSLAEELAGRGHNITFGTHNCLQALVESVPGVSFLSAGRMPMHDRQLRAKMKSISQAGGFWGLLTLLNDIYLPLARPMYMALLAAVQPSSSPPPRPPRSSRPPRPPDSGSSRYNTRCDASGRGTSTEREFNSWVELAADSEGKRECHEGVNGEGMDAEVLDRDEENVSREEPIDDEEFDDGELAPDAHVMDADGESVCGPEWESGVEDCSSQRYGASPFDLVVVDMGTLGGLDLAHKLGVPYIFNSPSLLFDLSGKHVSAALPGWGTGMSRRMSLTERLQNAISPRALSVFLTPAFISVNKVRREHGLEPFHAQDDVFHGARILVNTAFGLEYPYKISPLVEMTGPLLPPRVARALSNPHSRAHGSCSSKQLSQGDGDAGGPLALPFLIKTWLDGDGNLVAPDAMPTDVAAKTTTHQYHRSPLESQMGGHSDTAPDGDGVIYVSLGRMPQLDKWQLLTILQALSSPTERLCWGAGDTDDKLDHHRVLWVMTREQRDQLLLALQPLGPPPSIRLKVLGGFPHLGILAHPSIKAVISHCGMGAAQDALVFGKPVLCLPMMADQQDVAKRVVDAGAGLELPGLPIGNISAGQIRGAVAHLVSDPAFRGSAMVLSGILRRAGGTSRAADVVEGTLQLGGELHLYPPELKGPWHQTTSTDAYLLILASLILVAAVGYAAFAILAYLLGRLFVRVIKKFRSAAWNLPTIHSRLPRISQAVAIDRRHRGEVSKGAKNNDGPYAEASVTAALSVVYGGLWDETLSSFFRSNESTDPFPEDSMSKFDGPAINRPSPATPGAQGRNGTTGPDSYRGGGGSGGGRKGYGGTTGRLRSLSGEMVIWPAEPKDGRSLNLQGCGNGSGPTSNGTTTDVTPPTMQRRE